jgi:NAD-dependent SIR2 family protein deacetylase
MRSVRKGIRSGELEKDTYQRLTCTECGEQLATENDPDAVGTVRVCRECGTEWEQI